MEQGLGLLKFPHAFNNNIRCFEIYGDSIPIDGLAGLITT